MKILKWGKKAEGGNSLLYELVCFLEKRAYNFNVRFSLLLIAAQRLKGKIKF